MGGALLLQYKRVGGFAKRERMPFVVRLMREQPKSDVVRELVEAFGLERDEAEDQYAAVSSGGDMEGPRDMFRVSLRADTIPIIQLRATGRMGFEAVVMNVRSAVHMQRIAWLLRAAVGAAGRAESGILSWVPSRSPPSSSRKSLHTDQPSNRPVEGDAELFDGDDALLDLDALVEDELQDDDAGIDDMREDMRDELRGDERRGKPPLLSEDDGGNELDDADDIQLPNAHVLKMLYRADAALYKYKGSKYTTDCGRYDGRQPIVMTPEEKAKIDKDFPGSYTSAFNYGSTPELARRNVYMCPKVWCPKSRVSLSDAQLKALKGKCPNPEIDEEPVIFDEKYFKGREERYPGFLAPGKHPSHLCMPCCFRRPNQRTDTCLAEGQQDNQPQQPAAPAGKYILGDVAPLEIGRYGVLPPPLSKLLDNKNCGTREAGSGQIVVSTDCFVRKGIALNRQGFLQCVVDILDNPAIRTVPDLVSAIRNKLSPDVFVTLNDGQLCRAYMHASDPDDVLQDTTRAARFKAWMASSKEYVRRFDLSHVAKKVSDGGGSRDVLVRRECLVFSAMVRFFDELSNYAVIKTHLLLLDLVGRPLPWLNPRRIKIILFERDTVAGAPASQADAPDDLRVYMSCPQRGALPERSWQLSDPVVMVVRQGAIYEPVHRVRFQRQGVLQTTMFHYETDKRVYAVVSKYMEKCRPVNGNGGGATPGILAAMERAKSPARTQVVDYAFRLVGFVTESKLFIPLPLPESILVGDAGNRMGCMYISDITALKPTASPAACHALIDRIATDAGEPTLKIAGRTKGAKRIIALVTEGGKAVPIDLRPDDVQASGYLEHLNMFAGAQVPDERVRFADARRARNANTWDIRTKVVRSLRGNRDATQELLNLRSPFHPFPHAERRSRVRVIVRRFAGPGNDRTVERIVDALMYEQRPFSLQQAVPMDVSGAIILSDVDILSGAIERMSSKRMSPFEDSSGHAPRQDGVLDSEGPPHSLPALWRGLTRVANEAVGRSSRRAGRLPDVDVLAIMHLVHRMLHTDAPVPFASCANIVRDKLAADGTVSKDDLAKTLASHPTLRGKTLAAAIDAVGSSGYRGGAYDVEALSHYLDVNVVILRSGMNLVLFPGKTPSGQHLVLHQRTDGGMDAVLNRNEQKRLLFDAGSIDDVAMPQHLEHGKKQKKTKKT
jgi:hypothetical protein